MALFTELRLKSRAEEHLKKIPSISGYETFQSRSRRILRETFDRQVESNNIKVYDIFLSHSTHDAELILGLKLEMEDLGFAVYIDWIEDPQLSRNDINKDTALYLQYRMKQCKSLVYAFSENAINSKWMPWELGYFDGINGKVAVLPISGTWKSSFKGTEFLGMYYYIQIAQKEGSAEYALWVHESDNKYIILESWLAGTKPIQR